LSGCFWSVSIRCIASARLVTGFGCSGIARDLFAADSWLALEGVRPCFGGSPGRITFGGYPGGIVVGYSVQRVNNRGLPQDVDLYSTRSVRGLLKDLEMSILV
jgi:hypothetical protein